LVRVVIVDARIALDLPIEPGLSVRADDDRLDIELRANLLLPLLAEMRQTHDGEALDLAPLQQLAHDEQRFDRFADPNVVRDKQPHDVLPEGHDQGNNLIGSWPKRELGESAERTGAVAERQSG